MSSVSENHRFVKGKCEFCNLLLKDFAIERELFKNTSLWCKQRYRKQQFPKRVNNWLESFA